MISICSECLKDKFLKKYLTSNVVKGTCIICKFYGQDHVNAEEENFQNLFKAVVRYHYGEYHYNFHWGGHLHLMDFLLDENLIIEHRFKHEDDTHTLYNILTEKPYANYEEGVSLYYGTDEDGSRGLFGNNLQEEEPFFIRQLEWRIQEENHFLVEDTLKNKLDFTKNLIARKMKKNTCFYRARIGIADLYYNNELIGFGKGEYFYKAYTKEQISSPPPPKATAGRLNRHGVSYLYLSSDISTSVSEVRPHPGHLISVGEFLLEKDICIADLHDLDLTDFCTDHLLDDFVILNSIGRRFSMPVTPEEKEKYLLTQLFSDVFRQLGFHGVVFNSSVSSGFNLVLFYPELCRYSEEFSKVFSCEEVSYKIQDANENVSFNEETFDQAISLNRLTKQ
ncbi:RES domain-containing protein [Paenibacillus sp. CF095]|uniref:RES family NAD+ phosphorylase n=1 Tax=Paenibacillus sp. CF095 TaxID=1881033 RepID=UPI00088DB035|nr:RES family NAD+ phosphorylase [Paenibacillus sp. CF095]SDD55262.1 RES domain-containing protein [Paenibacillus sp. CF095]